NEKALASSRGGIVERLHPKTVSRENHPIGHAVIEREGKHAVEHWQARLAKLVPQVEQHFGVGPCVEDIAARNEIVAQLPIVVDLTVEDHPVSAIGIRHWLVAMRREIDDRQPTMAHRDGDAVPSQLVVRVLTSEGREMLVEVLEFCIREAVPATTLAAV